MRDFAMTLYLPSFTEKNGGRDCSPAVRSVAKTVNAVEKVRSALAVNPP
jgi:hypothetical protein